jgi:hypothetical protein
MVHQLVLTTHLKKITDDLKDISDNVIKKATSTKPLITLDISCIDINCVDISCVDISCVDISCVDISGAHFYCTAGKSIINATDAASTMTQLNALLLELRTIGLIK